MLEPAAMHAGHMAVVQYMMGKSAADSAERAMSHSFPLHVESQPVLLLCKFRELTCVCPLPCLCERWAKQESTSIHPPST